MGKDNLYTLVLYDTFLNELNIFLNLNFLLVLKLIKNVIIVKINVRIIILS